MLDIRIEVPDNLYEKRQEQKDFEATLPENVQAGVCYAIGEKEYLHPNDIWVRLSTTRSTHQVVYADVTLIGSPEGTKNFGEELAEAVKTAIENCMMGLPKGGVLVWIHHKDPDSGYAAREPS